MRRATSNPSDGCVERSVIGESTRTTTTERGLHARASPLRRGLLQEEERAAMTAKVTKRCAQCWKLKEWPRLFLGARGAPIKTCTACRKRYAAWSRKTPEEKLAIPRTGVPNLGELRASLFVDSKNRKLGGIPASITSRSTCPPTCSFYDMGCFKANAGRRGFLFTHKSPIGGYAWKFLRFANGAGLTINLSADSLDQADQYVALEICPVAVVIDAAEKRRNFYTPAGNMVTVCPAETPAALTCAECQLCAVPTRKTIVAFLAHGQSKALVSEIVKTRRRTA
jgi:hypothetical protein